ncbi:MAG: hypothetical protein AAF806_11985 [Bacteroidota bacterium]
MQAYNKPFDYWKTQEVEEVFSISPAKDKTRMEDWETVAQDCKEEERKELLSL